MKIFLYTLGILLVVLAMGVLYTVGRFTYWPKEFTHPSPYDFMDKTKEEVICILDENLKNVLSYGEYTFTICCDSIYFSLSDTKSAEENMRIMLSSEWEVNEVRTRVFLYPFRCMQKLEFRNNKVIKQTTIGAPSI